MDVRVTRAAVWVGLASVVVACGPKAEPDHAGRGTVEAEFNRCVEQEKYGEAKGCWHSFLDRFGNVASSAELAYAKEHVELGAPKPPAPGPTEDDAVTRAAKNTEGLVRLQEKHSGGTEAQPGFPAQRVAFDQCYKGFQVTGRSEGDVVGLGERCGAPCGMIPFSGVMSGAQRESDNVDVYGIDLRGDRCYRFIAVGDSNISDLDAAIADSEGNVLLRDVYTDSAPILGPEEPFCPSAAGHYKFVVSVAGGEGTFHFQVWQGARP
jgi:hypothetical protein